MKAKLKFLFAVVIAVVLLAQSCWEPAKPVEPQTAGYLLVNRQTGDFDISVKAEGEELEFSINCDAEWAVSTPDDQGWILTGTKTRTGSRNWTIPVTVESNEGEYPRTGKLTITAGDYSSTVSFNQPAPDPLTLNKIPGFYGLDGSVVTAGGSRQSSSFHYGDTWSYRIVDPVSLTVNALGGIPEKLVTGDVLPSLTYKTVVQGIVEHISILTGVSVVRCNQDMVWLRQGESVYFVLER